MREKTVLLVRPSQFQTTRVLPRCPIKNLPAPLPIYAARAAYSRTELYQPDAILGNLNLNFTLLQSRLSFLSR